MVKINLLSPEGNKGKKATYDSVPGLLLFFTLLFFLAGGALWLVTLYQKKSLKDTIAQYKKAEALAQKVNALKQDNEKLNSEIKFLDNYLERQVIWSDKLTQLGSLIPKEIWLTNLSFDIKKVEKNETYILTLKGSLIPQEKSSHIGTLSNFVGRIKSDKEFAENFGNPVLSDLRTESREKVEIMTFTLELPYRAK